MIFRHSGSSQRKSFLNGVREMVTFEPDCVTTWKVTTHPEGDKNVWPEFHSNPSNSCRDISDKNHKCEPHGGARRKVRGSPKSLGYIIQEPWTSATDVKAIHSIFVKIFH